MEMDNRIEFQNWTKTLLTRIVVCVVAFLIVPDLGQSEQSIATRIQRATQFEKAGEYDKVITELKTLTNELSNDGLMLLAKAYKAKKDYNNEIQVLLKILDINEFDQQAHMLIGQAYQMSQKADDAIIHYRAVIKSNPKSIEAYERLIDTFEPMAKNKPSSRYEVRLLYQDMIKTFGPKPRFVSEICRLYFEDSFLDNTITACQEAIQKDPQKAENNIYLGQAMIETGQVVEGKRVIVQAAKKFTNSELAQKTAGQIYTDEKNYAAAKVFLNRCVQLNPKVASCHLGLANGAYEVRDYNLALSEFYKACRLDPQLAIQDFRTATAKLRKFHNEELAEKFSQREKQCRD